MTENSTYNLLLIDDDEDFQNIFENMLRYPNISFKIDHARDDKIGLTKIKRNNYDAILLDYEFKYSASDGIKVLKEIRKFNEDISVIMFSAVADDRVLFEAKQNNISDILEKKFLPNFFTEILPKTIISCVEKSKIYKEGKRELKFLGFIDSTMELINKERNIGELCNKMLREVEKFIKCDISYISIYSLKNKKLQNWGYFDNEDLIDDYLKKDKSYAGHIYEMKEPLLINDVEDCDLVKPYQRDYEKATKDKGKPIQSFLGVPLIYSEKFVGEMALACLNKNAFTNDHKELLWLIARAVAVAINNAQAHEKLEKKVEITKEELESVRSLIHTQQLVSMGTVLPALVHQIYSPQTSSTQWLRNALREKNHKKREEYLSEALKDAEKVNDFINVIKNFSKSRIKTEPKIVLLNEIVEKSIEFIKITQPIQENIIIETNIDGNLKMKGLDLDLQTVFINIIKNSIEASTSNQENLIQINANEIKDNKIKIDIMDNGCGFPSEILGKAFEAFVTNKTEGIGLGLWTSKKIIDYHGGKILINNRRKGGGKVTIYLPIGCGD